MSKEWDPETVFDVLSCEYARGILLAAARTPRSAQELSDCCDVSNPTVYRRLDALSEYGLIDETLRYDEDGHHYRVFETAVTELTVSVNEAGIGVEDTSTRDLPDKFQAFWNDLEQAQPKGQLEHLVDLPEGVATSHSPSSDG